MAAVEASPEVLVADAGDAAAAGAAGCFTTRCSEMGALATSASSPRLGWPRGCTRTHANVSGAQRDRSFPREAAKLASDIAQRRE